MNAPTNRGAAPSLAARAPETFFRAQRRNRRATWRMSVLCVFAAFLMGIPLTLVLTPFFFAVTMAAAEAINHFWRLPPEFWQHLSNLAKLALRAADVVINQGGRPDPQELTIGVAVVFLPGIVAALMLWSCVLLLFRHGGVGGTIASLDAREPNLGDLKELQLADTTQEMAIAAGLPAPKLMLIDSPGANAAAIGTSPADAHLVLSRRLLDDLERDQLQALVGHLIASVGNGDLGIAFTITSVFETCGLIVTLINAPFGKLSRSTLWRIIRYAVRRERAEGKSGDAEEVAELLANTLDMNSSDIDRFFNSRNPGLIRKFLRLIFFPFLITNLAVEITLWFFLSVLLGPCMALLWRTRRYLADASAVELTRDPDALARALRTLSEESTVVAGGTWATHLFIVNPNGDRSLRGNLPSAVEQRKVIEAWRALGNLGDSMTTAAEPGSSFGTEAGEYARVRQEMMSTFMAAAMGNANALARMQTFAQAEGRKPGLGLHDLPNFNDLILAHHGDRSALARLRMRQSSQQQVHTRSGQSGLQKTSFVSFHLPLNKRVKRLQRMGAHPSAPTRSGSSMVAKIALAALYLIIVPLLATAGVLMLLVIAMIIGLNLLLLALWLTAIHWIFAQDWDANIRAFSAFVQQVIAAFGTRR